MTKTAWTAAALALGSTLACAQQTVTPADYWQQQARDGYMTTEDAVMYPTPAGRTASMIDSDHDGRVSQPEWARHHGASDAARSPDADTASDDADGNRNLADLQRRRAPGGTIPSTQLGNSGL